MHTSKVVEHQMRFQSKTAKQLADESGIPYQSLLRLLNGKRSWKEDQIDAVMNALGFQVIIAAKEEVVDS